MAKISTIKTCLQICRDAKVTPFVWGHRGIGKSSSVQQLAAEKDWGFIDMRCSQLEASDIRGLPDKGADGRTHYLPPADMPVGDLTAQQIANELGKMPEETDLEARRQYDLKWQQMQARNQNGILFLDEVNRAQDDVLQAIFELILDRKVGMYVLPPGWCVVCAGNFTEGYVVSGFNDPAFLNRLCHLTMSGGETTLEEWVTYMSSVHAGAAADVIEFASQNTKHLDGDIPGEMGFSVQPSRRSWDMVVRVTKACEQAAYDEQAKMAVYAGLVGHELAQAFTRYSCPVKPRELLQRGVDFFRDKLNGLSRNQLTGLMWGLVSFCKDTVDKDEIATVCLDFVEFLVKAPGIDKDIVVAFCRALVSGSDSKQDKARTAVISNPRLAQMISKFSKQNGETKKTFVDRLTERPHLQQILAKVAWGTDESDDEAPKVKAAKKTGK